MRGRTVGLAALVATLAIASEARALPTFARKYKTACTTCHYAPPVLNPFGEAFRTAGFRMSAAEEAHVRAGAVQLGAPEWSDLWPEAVWPGELSPSVPLALVGRLGGVLRYQPGAAREVVAEPDLPRFVLLAAAGTLGDHFGYRASVFATRAGVSLARTYVQADDLGTRLLNVRAGLLEPLAVPFSMSTDRFSSAHFLTSELALTRKGFVFTDLQRGVELWGALEPEKGGGGLFYGVGAAFPTRDPSPGAPPDTDLYWRVAYKLGGHGVLPDEDGDAPPVAQEESVRLGFNGYAASPTGSRRRYRAWRAGVDLELAWHGNVLYGNAWIGGDEPERNAAGDRVGPIVRAVAYFSELDLRPYPWLMPFLRYEGARPLGDATIARDRLVFGTTFVVRPNIIATVDGGVDLRTAELPRATGGDDLRVKPGGLEVSASILVGI